MKYFKMLKGMVACAVLALFVTFFLGMTAVHVNAEEESVLVHVEPYGEYEQEYIHYPVNQISMFRMDRNAASIIKARVLEAVVNFSEDKIDISDLNIPYSDEGKAFLRSVMFDDALIDYRAFYVYSYSYWRSDTEITGISLNPRSQYSLEDGSVNVELVERVQDELDKAIDEALSCVSDEMSDLEKIIALHDYLVSECDYDNVNYVNNNIPDESYNIIGTLLKRKCVCAGYAKTFGTLLQMVGIESYYVVSDAMNHAWNLVYLDGYWYHIDTTWDDPTWSLKSADNYADEGYVSHRYFLKSDEEFKNGLGHSGWSEDLPDAVNSGAYTGYIFCDLVSKLNYYDGYWYYFASTGRYERNEYIIKAKIDGTNSTQIDTEGYATFIHQKGDKLYYSVSGGKYSYSPDKVYVYDLKTGTESLVIDISAAYPGYFMREFAVKENQLVLVLACSEGESYRRITVEPDMLSKDVIWSDSLLVYVLGDTAPLYVQGTVNSEGYTFTSADVDIATVDASGMITSVGPGTTIITVTDKSGNVVTECHVVVDLTFVTDGISLSTESIIFAAVNETASITASGTGPSYAKYTAIAWSSSDEAVAKVSADGVVTAVGGGTAVITAKAAAGTASATCTVTVNVPVVVTGVKLDKENVTFTTAEAKAVKLTATVEPSQVKNKSVTWSSSDEKVALVDAEGNVTPVSNGKAVITVTTKEGGKTAVCNVVVNITEYDGVNYSAVFNYEYYLSKYTEVEGMTSIEALKYFVTTGMALGHQASEEFSLLAYRSNYPDLGVAFGSDNTKFYMHYISNGKEEGRNAKVVLVESETKYYGVDYADVYNYDYYINNNPDLKAAFGDNKAAALIHFANMGMKEGRQACESFGAKIYKFNYPELQKSFGEDMVLYYHHYMDYGKTEGRNGATRDFSAYCEYEGVNYTPVYNYEDYIERNPDVFDAYGLDANAVLKHFVTVGMAEGRQGSDDFNYNIYRSNYPDLEVAFGEDRAQYYLHYINSGYNEGRNAATSDYTSDTVYAGVDYADVYSYDYYVTANPDVAAAIGDNKIAILAHFVRNGMAEGRQGSAEFNVRTYMENNPDLAEEFGDDLKAYYMHYIEEGKEAGRVAN